jgi:hypothetical protein
VGNQPTSGPQAAYTGKITTAAIKFLHAACFSPTTATWTQTIDRGILLIHPSTHSKSRTTSTAKVHGNGNGSSQSAEKNLQSTCQRKRPSDKEVKEFGQDVNPDTDATTKQAFAGMIDMHANDTLYGQLYSDLTGRFPSKSQDRNLYVLVLYTYDDNAIIVEPLKNQTEGKQLAAYTRMLNQVARGTPLKCTGWITRRRQH